MAFQGKGILDGFSGSVGNLTGYKRNGKSIIKTKNSKRKINPINNLPVNKIGYITSKRIIQRMKQFGWEPFLNYKVNGISMEKSFMNNWKMFEPDQLFYSNNFNLFQSNQFQPEYLNISSYNPPSYNISLASWMYDLLPPMKASDYFCFIEWSTFDPIIKVAAYGETLRNWESFFQNDAPKFGETGDLKGVIQFYISSDYVYRWGANFISYRIP